MAAPRTWIDYHIEDDTFSLHSEAKNLELNFSFLASVRVPLLSSVYRVGRNGELRSMNTDLRASVFSDLLKGDGVNFSAISPEPCADGRFLADGWFEGGPGGKQDFKLEPVEMSDRAAVLNPLHPVNRLSNVRPGQRWRMPLMDPLADAVRRSVPGVPGMAESRMRILEAEVLVEPRSLEWNEGEASCLVIEYRSDGELAARTWVQASDGLVLRQEAMQGGEMLVLYREQSPHHGLPLAA